MAKMQFGVTLPQIKRTWQETRAAAEEFDRLGFHSVWFNDHLYGVPMPSIGIMEAWTSLAAVAAVTSKVELGTLVSPVGFRNPALLAKMAATVDQIAGGRVIVGIGGGWFAQEFEGYGYPFPPLRTRLEQLDEAAELMRRMWSEPQVTFSGKHFRAEQVYCEPKPARRPPILIGGGGEKVVLRLAARHADIWNNLAVDQEKLEHKVRVLTEHCHALGRNPRTICVSQQTMVVIGADAADAEAKKQKAAMIYGGHMGPGIAGTPEQIVETIERFAAMGCSLLIIEFFGRDTREPARLFAEKVMPAFA